MKHDLDPQSTSPPSEQDQCSPEANRQEKLTNAFLDLLAQVDAQAHPESYQLIAAVLQLLQEKNSRRTIRQQLDQLRHQLDAADTYQAVDDVRSQITELRLALSRTDFSKETIDLSFQAEAKAQSYHNE